MRASALGRRVAVLALAMVVATGCGTVDTVLAMAGRTSWTLANVVLALGGTIGVDSVPAAGASFWFELPLNSEP